MQFESVKSAAIRLGCTERAIQKWAKEGKIPYAYKDGRDWKIPIKSLGPVESNENTPHYHNEPFPIIHSYEPGKVLDYINSITNEEDRDMALCEYYYVTGNMKECTVIAEPYLDSKKPILRSSAAVFVIFANLCRGHVVKTNYAASIITESLEKNLNSPDDFVRAVNVFNSLIVATQLHLPLKRIPKMDNFMKYLDEGLKLFACYLTAYSAYLENDYSRALGIIETALNISRNEYPVSLIYLYIMKSILLINLMRTNDALAAIEAAWSYAEPDGMYMPFVEHYNLLQGLVEKHFKKNHTEAYNTIINTAKQYNHSWYEVYNKQNEASIAQNLTHTEFTVAMLYSRNWRAKEIAAHMELSERTITNYIAVIYDKLHINSRKELEKFMLK